MSQLRQVQRGQVFEFTKQEIGLEITSQRKMEEGIAMQFCIVKISSLYF